jgi:hypothetical protein
MLDRLRRKLNWTAKLYPVASRQRNVPSFLITGCRVTATCLVQLALLGCSSDSPPTSKKPTAHPTIGVTTRRTPESGRNSGPKNRNSDIPTSQPTPSAKRSPNLQESIQPRQEQAQSISVLGPPLSNIKSWSLQSDPSAQQATSAAEWRQIAERAVAAGNFRSAANAFHQEAELYRKVDPNAAAVEERKSSRYRPVLQVFLRQPIKRALEVQLNRPLSRLEPPTGCYLGAFVDRDDKLSPHRFGSQTFGDIDQFQSLTNKRHASYFCYVRYGNPFPKDWADYVKSQGAFPHIAWEPDSLAEVKNDNYLQQFAKDLKAYDHPVMLRFASEMNGDWTPYHKDPKQYRAAFRLVHDALQDCPKAATMWCVNSVPNHNYADYYPGDDACDWVGVNGYSVKYFDNDPKQKADWVHPVDLFETCYRQFSGRKPIAIGEFGATHRAACEPTMDEQFAVTKISQLYQSLPLHFPGIKMVNYYDCNNLAHAPAGRQLNNYQLTDSSKILECYEGFVRNGYFLGYGSKELAQWQPVAVKSDTENRRGPLKTNAQTTLDFYLRSHEDRPKLRVLIDGKVRLEAQYPRAFVCRLGQLSAGSHLMTVQLGDSAGHALEQFQVHLVHSAQ